MQYLSSKEVKLVQAGSLCDVPFYIVSAISGTTYYPTDTIGEHPRFAVCLIAGGVIFGALSVSTLRYTYSQANMAVTRVVKAFSKY